MMELIKKDNSGGLSLPIEMVKVAGGSFWMGDDEDIEDIEEEFCPKPAHKVELNDYYIGKYVVTQAQWRAVMGENPSYFKGCDLCPVESVSWDDEIQEFLKKLNARYPGKNYRLPTEAEWEYAARGGQLSKGYRYAGSNELDVVAWYGDNADDKTHPVGQKQANELGIYDMSGNVEEWCQDWYSGTYYQECHSEGIANNPKGPGSGKYLVVRGGSWYDDPFLCRVSFRNSFHPEDGDDAYGFRCARDL